jgi:topoisomerase IA-like protein
MSKYHSAEIWENNAEIWEKIIFGRGDMGKYVKKKKKNVEIRENIAEI